MRRHDQLDCNIATEKTKKKKRGAGYVLPTAQLQGERAAVHASSSSSRRSRAVHHGHIPYPSSSGCCFMRLVMMQLSLRFECAFPAILHHNPILHYNQAVVSSKKHKRRFERERARLLSALGPIRPSPDKTPRICLRGNAFQAVVQSVGRFSVPTTE